MGFQQGLSGLNISSKNLDVIGNNIANSSTVGFKASQAQFADVFAASLQGAGASPVGLGAKVSTVVQQFTQGNITSTNNPLDIAINGGGFYRMSDTSGAVTYTRNGQFQFDKNDYIVNASGLRLNGYPAVGGVVQTGTPVPIQLDRSDVVPLATGTSISGVPGVEAKLNLDSRKAVPLASPFNPTNPTTFTDSTSLAVYDSLGNSHTYTMYFAKNATANTWDVYSTVTATPGADAADIAADKAAIANGLASILGAVTAAAPTTAAAASAAASAAATAAGATATQAAAVGLAAATAFTSGTLVDVTSGLSATQLTFDSSGVLQTVMPFTQNVATSQYGSGSAAGSFPVEFTGTTQYGGNFSVNTLRQDGYALGKLSGFNVSADGTVVGRYTNGQSKNMAQVVLAGFANPQGLQSIGGNQWTASSTSGAELIGAPGSDGQHGTLQSSSVEDSNIDLTAELVNMITAQRVYQANAQSIKTQDSVLQTLVNLR